MNMLSYIPDVFFSGFYWIAFYVLLIITIISNMLTNTIISVCAWYVYELQMNTRNGKSLSLSLEKKKAENDQCWKKQFEKLSFEQM